MAIGSKATKAPIDPFSDQPRNIWDRLRGVVQAVEPDEPIVFVEWIRELSMEQHTLSATDRHASVAGHRSMAEQSTRHIVQNRLVERARR